MELRDFASNGCQSSANSASISHSNFNYDRTSVVPVYRLHKTSPLAIDCAAKEMKDALESLPTVARVDVTRSVLHNGFTWLLTFRGFSAGASTDFPPLYLNSVNVSAAINGTAYVYAVGEYVAGGLSSDEYYSASVAATNSYGMGSTANSVPASQQPNDLVPSPPLDLRVFVLADSSLQVEFNAALKNGGQNVSSYRVQWDTTPAFSSGYRNAPLEEMDILSNATSRQPEVQVVYVVSQVGFNPAGTFVLSFLGQRTVELDYNISAQGLKYALERLSTINEVDVHRQLFCSQEAGLNNCGLERGYRCVIDRPVY